LRFLDAKPFVYAFYKPSRKLSEVEKRLNEEAKAIIGRLDAGEKVLTTAVQVSEVAEVLPVLLSGPCS
jgi:hypothetical protein